MPGVYIVRVRRIDGTLVGNRAQLSIVRNQGAKNETTETFVFKLTPDRIALRIPLPNGRRRELGPERPALNSRAGQLQQLLQALIAYSPRPRQIPWRALPAAMAPGGSAIAPAAGGGGGGGAAGGGGAGGVTQAGGLSGAGLNVGYQPNITEIDEGVKMSVAAVVSSDLRYVRLAVNPSFTTITEVFTFTFVGNPP
jgi:hypothetical protein